MMQLMINGKETILPDKSSFKLTRCNSYFDPEKGDFTFEVTLPLKGCPQNMAIFGPIQRIEIALKNKVSLKEPMTLVAPPISINGYASIKSINEREVKVQLVAGRSAIKHGITERNEYIDELDLGKAWDTFSPFDARIDIESTQTYHPGTDLMEMKRIFHEMPTAIDNPKLTEIMAWGTFGQTDCVAFRAETPPINNWDTGGTLEFYDTHVNPWKYERVVQDGITVDYRRRMDVPHDSTGYHWERTQLAPQPYLFDILPRIIRAIGYVPGDFSYYTNSWMKNILIVNTNPDIRRAKCLPHWTIGKFFTELQRFLGSVWVINGNRVDLRPVAKYYDGGVVTPLDKVVDEYTAEIDEEADYEGTAGANIDYLWPDMDDKLKLPDEVFDNADIQKFSSENDMRVYYSDLDVETQQKSHQLYDAGLSKWASLHDAEGTFSLVKVDQAGAMVNDGNDRNVDIELAMVPALINEAGDLQCSRYYRPTLYSIDSAINGADSGTEDSKPEERDVMELACNDGDSVLSLSEGGKEYLIPTAVGFPWRISDAGMPEIPANLRRTGFVPEDGRFSLNATQMGTVGNHLAKNLKTVDARIEKNIEFLDDVPLDPSVPYLIKNRIYACHKLECSIDAGGLQPLKRGSFFEIS